MKEVQTTVCIVNSPRQYSKPAEKLTKFNIIRKVDFLNLFETLKKLFKRDRIKALNPNVLLGKNSFKFCTQQQKLSETRNLILYKEISKKDYFSSLKS